MNKQLFYRLLSYVIGLTCIAFGTAFSVNSQLGVSPVNSLPYAVSAVSGMGLGTCVIIVYSCYVLIQFLLQGKAFQPKNLLQVVFSTLFGYLVDFAKWAVGDFAIPTYFGQLAMLAISMVIIGIGLCFYLSADIIPLPMEGLSQTITNKLKLFPFHNVKIATDCLSVLLAIVISFIGTGRIVGVREGTVIAALFTGKIMALLLPHIKPRIQALCFPAQKDIQTTHSE